MPSFYLPEIKLYDPMVDTVDSAIMRISLITNKNFDIVKRLLYSNLDSTNIRSGGILLSDLMGGLLPQTPTALGEGLNLTSEYMGYFDGTNWQVYIDEDGNFYFGGDEDNYIMWNGTTLFVGGQLDAVTGTFEVIGAGDFPDGAKVLLGEVDDEPLIEMYDADETLRVRLEKDRLAFYTEYVAAEGEDPEIESVYAGMLQGLFWVLEDGVVPEVRLETPYYSNFITIDSEFTTKYARLATIATEDEVFTKLVASNVWAEGGDTGIADMFSILQLDEDITLNTGGDISLICDGTLISEQLLHLNSETYEDHLKISRYDETADETYTLKVTHEVSNQCAAFILEDDAGNYIFYVGTDAIMQVDSTGGGGGGTDPCVRIWGDLEVEGDIYEGGWV